MRRANAQEAASRAAQTPLPPEQPFWQRYSPHHEFPLSTASAFGLFFVACGVLLLAALLQANRMHGEVGRPPEMNIVEIANGTDGLGTLGEGGPGQVPGRHEAVEKPGKEAVNPWQASENLPETIKFDLLKVRVPSPEDPPNGEDIFEKVAADAKQQAKDPPAPKVTGKTRKGNFGEGGFTGGKFVGSGPKQGKDGGHSPPGVVLSKQRHREMRWKINFSGNAEEHLNKLKAIRVLLALPSRQPGIFEVWDMSAMNPTSKLDNLARYRDRVQWFNKYPPSMMQLAQALRLPQPPAFAAIILPPDVEQEMLRLEEQYKGRKEHQIQSTVFEIQHRDGRYQPVVTAQYEWGKS
jgi:hypothetical protein